MDEDPFFNEGLPHADSLSPTWYRFVRLYEQPVDHLATDHAPFIDDQMEFSVFY